MTSTKLAFLAIAVLFLQASWCIVAQQAGIPAVMVVTSFEQGAGGGPAACDGRNHSDEGLIVALSTQWYAGGSRCHKHIIIQSSQNANTVVAQVLDECDTRSGCKNNMIAASKAVWAALRLDTDIGKVPIAWWATNA